MNKRNLIITFAFVAILAAGIIFGTDIMGATYLADPKPGG